MDIFRWLDPVAEQLREAGQHRFAHQLYDLPSHVVDNEHEVVDALVPEMLAEAKRLQHPWLEVFVRHWSLQSRILKRSDVATALDDAVYLLDLASRPDTEQCPQSICAVQDLCAGYGIADGPGYVAERLAVCDETLAKISPEWPCYKCISSERASALADAGRLEEALAYRREAVAAQSEGKQLFDADIVQFLIDLGRLEEALVHAEYPPEGLGGEHEQINWHLRRAQVRALMGRGDEAVELAPDFDRCIRPTPSFYPTWLEMARALVDGGQWPNDGWLDARLEAMAETLEKHGARRRAFEATADRLHLAAARAKKRTAERCLEDLLRRAEALHQPLDAAEIIGRGRAAVDALPSDLTPELPETAEATLHALPEDPELRNATLDAAASVWPTDPQLLTAVLEFAETPASVDRAEAALEAALEAESENDFFHVLQGSFIAHHRPERLESWARERLAGSEPARLAAHWTLGRDALRKRSFAKARQHLEVIVEVDERARPPRVLLSEALLGLELLDEALLLLDAASEHDPEDQDLVWRRLQIATRLGRWEVVRTLAAELGMTLEPGTGPVDEYWGPIRLSFPATITGGPPETVGALRTGPVTARVSSIPRPGLDSRYRHEVVFDARPLDTEAEADEDDLDTYAVIEVTKAPQSWSFFIEGRRPSAEVLDALEAQLREAGAGIGRVNDEDWEMQNAETEATADGFYWVVGADEETDLKAMHAALLALTETLEDGLLAWLDLVEKVGDEAEAERQHPIVEAWSLL